MQVDNNAHSVNKYDRVCDRVEAYLHNCDGRTTAL